MREKRVSERAHQNDYRVQDKTMLSFYFFLFLSSLPFLFAFVVAMSVIDESAPVSSPSSSSSSSSSSCFSCSSPHVLYSCPSCSSPSCSLSCVQSHKLSLSCNGRRARSTFVPVSQMSDALLSSDLFFLDETRRALDASARLPVLARHKRKRETVAGIDSLSLSSLSPFSSLSTSPRFLSLQRAATLQGIRLMLMPEGMKRHESNQSCLNAQTRDIEWTVELKMQRNLYPSSSFSSSPSSSPSLVCLSDPVPSSSSIVAPNTTVSDAETSLTCVLDRVSQSLSWHSLFCWLYRASRSLSPSDSEDEEERKELKALSRVRFRASLDSSTLSCLKSFLPDDEHIASSMSLLIYVPMRSIALGPSFYRLSWSSVSIGESLRHCTLLEYPTVLVVPSSLCSSFVFANEISSNPVHEMRGKQEEKEEKETKERSGIAKKADSVVVPPSSLSVSSFMSSLLPEMSARLIEDSVEI